MNTLVVDFFLATSVQKHRSELATVNVTIKLECQLYLSISICKTNWTADKFQNLLCEAIPESVKLIMRMTFMVRNASVQNKRWLRDRSRVFTLSSYWKNFLVKVATQKRKKFDFWMLIKKIPKRGFMGIFNEWKRIFFWF